MFLSSFQAWAEHDAECSEYCSSNETTCLENTPTMDPSQAHARKAICEKRKEECLSACTPHLTPPQDAEGAQVEKSGYK
jgi:hypothetical protein